MIGVWKEWNLQKILRKAYENGVVMSGVSAGAICWFNKGMWTLCREIRGIDCQALLMELLVHILMRKRENLSSFN